MKSTFGELEEEEDSSKGRVLEIMTRMKQRLMRPPKTNRVIVFRIELKRYKK